ncbi:hypothetical protein OIU84_011378 [Salix udensis]|uniref:Uncharacterized protein n=1 Tax=Salix udensis TaxID=889485 RepID=A0AAD6NWX2_9ROSI|nr:hypothetical protein OIU84_011378 [Salix udensis]
MVSPFTGPNSTASQFSTTAKKSHLDGKRVTFGKLSRGTGVDLSYWHAASEGIISLKVSSCLVREVLRGETMEHKTTKISTYPDWSAHLDTKPDDISWGMEVVHSFEYFGMISTGGYKIWLFENCKA